MEAVSKYCLMICFRPCGRSRSFATRRGAGSRSYFLSGLITTSLKNTMSLSL